MKPSDYRYAGYSGNPFTDEELEIVPNSIKQMMVSSARSRFPRNSRLVANAMIGAIAILMRVGEEWKKNER